MLDPREIRRLVAEIATLKEEEAGWVIAYMAARNPELFYTARDRYKETISEQASQAKPVLSHCT